MSLTRRSFLKFFGGASVGAVLSPLPWKLLDDVSIWTQNGTWVEHPARGPVSHLYSHCTLCPEGCAQKLRRIGERVVSAWGVPEHPLGKGCLCPAGLGVVQIPFHPARLRGAAARSSEPGQPWQPVDAGDVAREVGRRLARLRSTGGGARMAVLDLRPGRSLSVLYDEFVREVGGRYLVLPDGRDQSALELEQLAGAPGMTFGLDLANARSVISFGAPLFDGWAGGGPAKGLMPASEAQGRRPTVIQVQSNRSMNAGLADMWLPIKPGSESALALGLAFIVRHEIGLASSCRDLENALCAEVDAVLKAHTPEKVTGTTGITPREMRKIARDLALKSPSLAVGTGDPGAGPLGRAEELAIGILNLTLGAVGRKGGLVSRPSTSALFDEPAPDALALADLPDGSLDLLIVDGSASSAPVPRGLLRRKMSGPDALIVALSPFAAGPAAGADYVIPTAAPGEWAVDVPARALAPNASYSRAAGVGKAPLWSFHPADALGLLADAGGLPSRSRFTRAGHGEILDRRVAVLHARGRGRVFDPVKETTGDLARIGSPRALKKVLERGGCWFEPGTALPPTPHLAKNDVPLAARLAEAAGGRLPAAEASHPLTLMASGPAMAAGGGLLPTVVNKLYRESNLLSGSGIVFVNPATARRQGLRKGRPAVLQTRHGEAKVVVRWSESVMPDVVLVTPAPTAESLGDPTGQRRDILQKDILEVCGALVNPVYRVERAALREL